MDVPNYRKQRLWYTGSFKGTQEPLHPKIARLLDAGKDSTIPKAGGDVTDESILHGILHLYKF
jgi:hypothetical protein